MQVADASGAIPALVIKKIDTDLFTGAAISDRMVLFSKSGALVTKPFTITVAGTGYQKVLITDIQKGTWKITDASGKRSKILSVNDSGQLLYFSVLSGTYKLVMQ